MNQSPTNTNIVTLSDVLRLALPAGSTPPGRTEYINRPINWVVVLTELSQLQQQARPDDLVILPAALQNGAKEASLQAALQSLAEMPVAALLLFLPLPERLAMVAAGLNLPIVLLPAGTPLREVHQEVSALLVDQQTQLTRRGMQLYRQLSEMSREGKGLAAMIEVISQLTGKIVVVQDKRLDIQALTQPTDSPVDEASLRQVLRQGENLPRPLRNRKAVVQSGQSYWQQILPLESARIGRLVSPVISGDRARGYLSIIGPPEALDLLDTLAVEQGAAACALEMAKAKAVSEAKKSLRGDFLEGLLAGTLPRQEIERLAGRLDHDTSQSHAILTFAWAGDKMPSMRRLETTLNWLVASHKRPALAYIHSDNHACVFQVLHEADSDLSTALELAHQLREQLRAEFPEARLLAGLSGPARSLVEWPEVHRQAVQAMQLAQRLGLERTVDFNSLGIYQLLTQLDNLPAVQQFCRQVINPLADYDKRHSSNLVQTVAAYFEHHGNISQTAEALYVHRNTLLYRLERIQSLTRYDLNQPDMRLALHLSLKLWQLRPEAKSP